MTHYFHLVPYVVLLKVKYLSLPGCHVSCRHDVTYTKSFIFHILFVFVCKNKLWLMRVVILHFINCRWSMSLISYFDDNKMLTVVSSIYQRSEKVKLIINCYVNCKLKKNADISLIRLYQERVHNVIGLISSIRNTHNRCVYIITRMNDSNLSKTKEFYW